MTLSEFKCWVDGYRDGKGDEISREEWVRIRQKLRDEVSAAETKVDVSAIFPTTAPGVGSL